LRRGSALLLVFTASWFGCSAEKPAAAPPPSPLQASPAPGEGIRPLTSRDEAKPFAADPAPAQGLPAGHPPIGETRSGQSVAGTVSIAPGIAAKAAATDVLYLIARSRASNAVVAVRRETDVRFPHAFELSSADAMTADQPFAGPFEITARLSRSGDALPAPGDLEGTASNVTDGAQNVSVVIEKVRE
jgi:cytochrome c-type biogenesis protein CcmH